MAITMAICMVEVGDCQLQGQWEAMRINVPDDQIDLLADSDKYQLIAVEDLGELLRAETARRQAPEHSVAGIEEAIYLAEISEKALVSKYSRWKFRDSDARQPVDIGTPNVALHPGDASRNSLTNFLHYQADGRGWVAVDRTISQAWFGFVARPTTADPQGGTYQVELPGAVFGKLIVSVPIHLKLWSSTVAISEIEQPNAELPADWPDELKVNQSPLVSWYVMHVSGCRRFDLKLSPREKNSGPQWDLNVRTFKAEYVIRASEMRLRTECIVPWQGVSQVRFAVDTRLRLRAIRVDKEEVAWRREPARDSRNTVSIELPSQNNGMHQIQVEAFMPLQIPFSGVLPTINIERGFVVDGRSNLISSESLLVEELKPAGFRAAMSLAPTATGQTRELPEWRWDWQGAMDAVEIRIADPSPPWQVRSLTKFSVHPAWFDATSRLHLTGRDLRSNRLELEVGRGWFVDDTSCTLEGSSVSTDLQQLGGGRSKLVVHWDEVRSNVELDLVLSAHVPRTTNVELLRLPQSGLISLASADQQDAYVVETTGQYQLQVDTELLQLRLTEVDLLGWQKAMLPRLSETWIFRGVRGNLPPLTMRRIRGAFTTTCRTFLTKQADELHVEYRLACLPVSGGISKLQVVIPAAPSVTASAWAMVSLGNQPAESTMVTTNTISSSPTETVLELTFSRPLTQLFELSAKTLLRATDGSYSVSLPSAPEAASQEGQISLPHELWQSVSSMPLELLPPGTDSFGSEGASSIHQPVQPVVQCRYDPNSLTKIDFTELSQSARIWAWDQTIDNWQSFGEATWHEVRWNFMSPKDSIVRVTVPAQWTPTILMVNGVNRRPLPIESNQSLSISLPPGARVPVTLICKGPSTDDSWLTRLEPVAVNCSVQTLHHDCRYWIAPGKMSVEKLLVFDQVKLLDRLNPKQWWDLLRPDGRTHHEDSPAASTNALTDRVRVDLNASHSGGEYFKRPAGLGEDWELIRPPTAAPAVKDLSIAFSHARWWIVDKAAISAIVTASLCLLSIFIFHICAVYAWRWLSLAALLSAACLSVPVWLVGMVQGICLAFAIALTVRITAKLARLHGVQRPSLRRGSTVAKHSVLGIAMIVFGQSTCSCGVAQDSRQLIGQANRELHEPGKYSARKIYGILVPTDQQQTPAGNLVYAPRQLIDLLENPQQGAWSDFSTRIHSVSYRAHVQSTMSQRASIAEVTVDLNVTLTSDKPLLRFPVYSAEVQLARFFVDGIEVFGSAFRQESDHIVWSAPSAKQYNVQLILVPRGPLQELDGRGRLAFRIPPIATARLEIRSESTQEIEVSSVGEVHRDERDSLVADLGPVSQLDISWQLRTTPDVVPQVFAHTWVRIRHTQVVAYAQLNITGATALPENLVVAIDSQWYPVGNQWLDAVMIPAETSVGQSRTLYAVRRSRLGSDNATVRVLLLPRDPETSSSLPIPFLSLQESQPLMRTLAVSVPGFPGWKLEGTESWHNFAQPMSVWGDAKLAEQPVTLRVPLGNVAATLIKQPISTPAQVDETTEIHIRQPETVIRYSARWKLPLESQSSLSLQIPRDARVIAAHINQLPASFNVTPMDDFAHLALLHDIARGGVQSLDLELALPNRLNSATRLSRPILMDSVISSSYLRLTQGAELVCRLIQDSANAIELVSNSSPVKDLLANLEQSLGDVELGGKFRESVYLPLTVEISRRKNQVVWSSALRMVYQQSGWVGQFECELETPSEPLDYYFVDMPVEFRDSYQTQTTSMTLPSAESNRITLCIVPPPSVNGKTRLGITLKLPSAFTQQSIRIPDLRVFWSVRNRPVLALPDTLDGQPIQWSNTGRKLSNSKSLGWFAADGYTLYENNESQQQLSWQTIESPNNRAKIHLIAADVQYSSASECLGTVELWIEPRRQSTLKGKLPEHLEIVGAVMGEHVANWEQDRDRQVQFLLQPSHLPTRLTLLVRWRASIETSQSTGPVIRIVLPQWEANVEDCQMFMHLDRSALLASTIERNSARGVNVASVRNSQQTKWRGLLDGALSGAMLRSKSALIAWSAMWQPAIWQLKRSVRVPTQSDSATTIDSNSTPEQFERGDLANLQPDLPTEYWRTYLAKLGIEQSVQASPQTLTTVAIGNVRENGGGWFEVTMVDSFNAICRISEKRTAKPAVAMWLVAALMIVLGGSVVLLGRRIESVVNWLAIDQTWVLVAILSLLAWAMLPIVWPSYLIAGLAMYSLGYRLLTRPWRNRHLAAIP